MKQSVNPFDYAGEICSKMKQGILLTTAAHGKVNTMTIGWGHMGIEWGKPIFVAYVRKSRHTCSMLGENGEFTVNVPMDQSNSHILSFCGSRSGRDVDKVKELNLQLETPLSVSVPGIRQLPLTLECKVLYTQKQDLTAMPAEVLERYYPADEAGERDYHIAFYGEIVNAYLIQE